MRAVFMGTPEFAVPSLKALIEGGHEVAGVFTQPDRPKGRGNKMILSPVKEVALAHGIPVFQPQRIRRDGVEDLRSLAPDLCVTAAFGQILSKEILDIPKLGTINVHASLLPKHRGSAPINWSIIMGDTVTGVTTMMTDVGIDTGDMLLKKETAILPEETAGELTLRLSTLGAEALIETLAQLATGTLSPIAQNEGEHTYEPMLKKEMGRIDWSRPAGEIVSLIRGLNPWPGACTETPQGLLKVWQAQVVNDMEGTPGQVLVSSSKQGLVVAAGQGAVRLESIQCAGTKCMEACNYLCGRPFTAGAIFGENPPE